LFLLQKNKLSFAGKLKEDLHWLVASRSSKFTSFEDRTNKELFRPGLIWFGSIVDPLFYTYCICCICCKIEELVKTKSNHFIIISDLRFKKELYGLALTLHSLKYSGVDISSLFIFLKKKGFFHSLKRIFFGCAGDEEIRFLPAISEELQLTSLKRENSFKKNDSEEIIRSILEVSNINDNK